MSIDNLREISLTSTSKGMLYKCIGNDKGKKVYIKTGTKMKNKFSTLEPISEAMAYEIINLFSVPCAVNYLDTINIPNIGDNVLVSISVDFLNDNESLLSIRSLLGNADRNKIYTTVTELLPQFKNDIDVMIVMDFLINNIDRHLRNFGVISKDGEVIKFSPLYDHGLSLYADIHDFELQQDDAETWEMIDECKPFANSHYKQLDLIGDVNLNKVSLKDILSVVDKYEKYLSEHRILCIKHLLEVRYNYLLEKEIL